MVMQAPGDIVEHEMVSQVSHPSDVLAERKNRLLQRVDSRKVWQDPTQVMAEERMKRLAPGYRFDQQKAQEVPIQLKPKKSVNFDDKLTTVVEPDEQPEFEKPMTLWEKVFGTKPIEYEKYQKTHKPKLRSQQDLQKRQISDDALEGRLKERKEKNEKANKRWQFRQQKEENMTEQELADLWEAAEQNPRRANQKVEQKVAQGLRYEELKKYINDQRSLSQGGVRSIAMGANTKPVWARS